MLNRFKRSEPTNRQLRKRCDQDLITKFQVGDLDSFAPLYSHFYKPIYKYILKFIRSTHVAEELTQDIFLKIYQYRKSYNPEYELSTWIWTIAKNTVYDHLRQSRSTSTTFQQPENPNAFDFEPAHTETAETIIIEEFEKRKLLILMASLSSKQKEAIFLRLVKRFSYQEISKSMNLSLSAVKSLINRGKSSLIKLSMTIY